MNFSNANSIRKDGFKGFLSVSNLIDSRCCDIPDSRVIYLVLRLKSGKPSFCSAKYRESKYSTKALREHWIYNSVVLYIGKASKSLRDRIYAYVRFGQNKNSGHAGGRSIWHLSDSNQLILCWKITPDSDPIVLERDLIKEFKSIYSYRPYANRRD